MKFLTYQETVTRIENKQDLDKIFMATKVTVTSSESCNDLPNIVFKPLKTKTVCEIAKDTSIFIDISEDE